ncbi:MAG: hypothetical protein AB7G28_20645 [Pirellulales bacterium]
MAKEKVDISVDADTARAIANLTEVVRAQAKMGDAAADVGEKGKSGAKKWGEELEHVVGKWFTIHKVIDTAIELVKKFLEEQKKLREEQFGATKAINTGLTSYRIAQGNLSDSAGQEAAANILRVAQENRSSVEGAFGTATMLAKNGVGRQEAEGSALAEMLQLQDLAQAQGTMDPSALSRGIMNALNRYGRPVTGENIRQFGTATFGLSRQLKGFDEGEVGITADVATYGRRAGLSLEETAGVVGLLSEAYGEGTAKRRFKSLFKDNEYTLAEKKEIAGLRSRAKGLLKGSPGEYSEAVEIAGGSMADEEELAKTRYGASGYKPGILDDATIRQNLISALRAERGGPSVFGDAMAGYEFDIAAALSGEGGEGAINNLYNPNAYQSSQTEQRARARRIRDRALGREEFTIRLQTPDGRDVPIQSEAEALNIDFSNDANQSANFRP